MVDVVNHFEPHPLFSGGILQTIIGSQFTGTAKLPQRASHKVSLGGNSGLVMYELLSGKNNKPLVLLAHGMGGYSESGYMRRVAQKLWSRGFGVFMMNHRGSGAGMGMSDRLWNGGSSDDLEKAVHYIIKRYPRRPLLIAGFSLSGNILLKYLGEGRRIPSNVHGAFAVNPPVDLKASSLELSYGRFSDLFNRYYMGMINRQCSALIQCFPKAFLPPGNMKTIHEFDTLYTAFAAGYRDVEEYYEKCSARQFLRQIVVPTTILSACDDPFVHPDAFQGAMMSLSVHYIAPKAGGHMGYISKKNTPLGDYRWMDYVIVEWAGKVD